MKRNEEDIIRLQISKKKLEDELENVLMKNSILLKMNKDIKEENKKMIHEAQSLKEQVLNLESDNYEIKCKVEELDQNDD